MAKFGRLGKHTALDRWYVRVDGKQVYLTGKGGTQEEAEKALEEVKRKYGLDASTDKPFGDDSKLKDVVQHWLEKVKGTGCAKHERLRQSFSMFLSNSPLGERTLRSIQPWEIEKEVNKQRTWGDTYKNQCYKYLSACFNWLTKNTAVSKNPVKAIKRPLALVRGEEYVLSSEEFKRLVDASKAIYKPILRLLWATGARPDEILGATSDEYDEQRHALVKTHHKTAYKGKKRVILLNDDAEAVVAERILFKGDGLLFRSIQGNKIAVDVFNQYVGRLASKVGIKHPVIGYSFRHSFAVRYLEAGKDIYLVAKLLGNTVKVVEQHYAHTIERLQRFRHQLLA